MRKRHAPRDHFIQSTLQTYNNVILKALRSYLPSKEPRRHLYDLLADYPQRGGKGFRPALCIATCRAFGGTMDQALRSAVALELLHNAFLIHDDIEDGSEFRRGSPTLNAKYGTAIALNAGDAMNVLSIRPLMENLSVLGPGLTWLVFAEIEHMVRQSVEGQAMELGWVRDNIWCRRQEDYLRMTLKKTCWYTCIHPCRIGALIGRNGEIDASRFNSFGYYMGAAFQIQDDILNLAGTYKRYGKEICGDIWEGKRTMMLIDLMHNCNQGEKARLQKFLKLPRPERTEKEVKWIVSAMEKYDCIESARINSRQLAGAALKEFFIAYHDARPGLDKDFIREIILYMIERDL